MRRPEAPLVAHVIYRLDVGGLENGLVNLINRMPAERYRHAIVCLTGHTDFRRRIQRDDVEVFSLDKPPGNSPRLHLSLWRLFRALQPEIVHTRNLGALEAVFAAALAGVPARVHGEHGRDVDDLDGGNVRQQRIRRLFRPFVHRYIALSRDLQAYLQHKVGVPGERIERICNGVDSQRFHPAAARAALGSPPFEPGQLVIGTVGRMQAVKDQVTLAHAFVQLVRQVPDGARRLRLAMIGEGPLRAQAQAILAQAGLAHCAWLPGERADIPEVLRAFDVFVLPSLAEGISNTILEAMASGLPVVATAVGGNAELVEEGVTGALVPAADPARLAAALRAYAGDAGLRARHAAAARHAVERRFGMDAMVSAYMSVYDALLGRGAVRLREEHV